MSTFNLKTTAVVVLSAALAVGCASDRQQRRDDARNAALGAAGGAVIGAVTGGDALTGAAVGAVAGAVLGRLLVDGREREVYSDGRGGRYWVDNDGRRHPVR